MRVRPQHRLALGRLAVMLALAGAFALPSHAQDNPAPEAGPGDRAVDRAGAPDPLSTQLPVPGPGASPILSLNQDRLFQNSDWGRAVAARVEADTAALAAENRGIEAELEQVERDLTEQRKTMTPAEFAPLAQAFDERAEEARDAQDAKSRAIARRLDEDRQRFMQAIRPILAELMLREGAQAVLFEGAMIVSRGDIDVTDEAVALINQRLPPSEAETDESSPAPQVSPAQPGGGDAPMTPPTAP